MKCVYCQKHLRGKFSLCRQHEEEFGKTAEERPAWLNFLISESVIEERDRIDEENNLLSFEHIEELMDYGNTNASGIFHQMYRDQDRPTEEEAIDNITKEEF